MTTPHSIDPRPVTVFVCGPYRAATASGIDANILKAQTVAAECVAMGAMPLTPHLNTARFEDIMRAKTGKTLDEQIYLDGYKHLLKACDIVFVIDPDNVTEGMLGELVTARRHKMPIVSNYVALKEAIDQCLLAPGVRLYAY